MDDIDLDLFGRETDQRVGQSLYGTVHVTLDNHVQLLEVTHRNTTADIIQGQHLLCTQTQFALQLFTTVGNLASLLFCLQDIECITSLWCTIQAQNQSRFGRTRLFDPLVTLVEHRLDTTEVCTCQHNVTNLQSSILNQHGRYITTTLVE